MTFPRPFAAGLFWSGLVLGFVGVLGYNSLAISYACSPYNGVCSHVFVGAYIGLLGLILMLVGFVRTDSQLRAALRGLESSPGRPER